MFGILAGFCLIFFLRARTKKDERYKAAKKKGLSRKSVGEFGAF
jgi:hypothetical protein